MSGGISAAAIEAGLVRALRALPAGAKPNTGAIRREIGCSNAELGAVIQSMRFKGKIEFARLALSPSMMMESAQMESAQMDSEAAAFPGGPAEPADEGDAGVADAAPASPEPAAPLEVPAMVAGAAPRRAVLLSAPEQLLRDIEAYCRRTGTNEAKIGEIAFRHPGFVGLLRKRLTARAESIAAVRALIDLHPDGLAGVSAIRPDPAADAPSMPPEGPAAIVEQVREEAEQRGARRGAARKLSGTRHVSEVAGGGAASDTEDFLADQMSAIERLQSAFVAEPGETARIVGRTHPLLWRRCMRIGRAVGERPMVILYRAIEAGLPELEASAGLGE